MFLFVLLKKILLKKVKCKTHMHPRIGCFATNWTGCPFPTLPFCNVIDRFQCNNAHVSRGVDEDVPQESEFSFFI